MLKIFLVRLLLCGLCLGGAYGMVQLSITHPGRSVNTGMPDSGIFGWIGAIFLMGAIASLFVPSEDVLGKKK